MTNQLPVLEHIGIYGFCWGKVPPTAASLTAYVTHAESCGIDSVHFPWHFTLSPESFDWGNRTLLDPLVVLPLLAGRTSRIRFALDPWVPSVMHPFVWAQFLSSLSAMTGGRVMSGTRTAWWPDDISVGQSSSELSQPGYEQALEVVTKLWRGEVLDGSESTIWQVAGLALDPVPVRPLPLWIDGKDDVAIRRAARWGDALRPLFATPDELRELRKRLTEAADAAGRPVGLVTSTVLAVLDPEDSPAWIKENVTEPLERRVRERDIQSALIVGTPDQCAERLQALFDAGVEYLLLDTQFHGWQTEAFSADQVSRLVEGVLPHVSVAGVR